MKKRHWATLLIAVAVSISSGTVGQAENEVRFRADFTTQPVNPGAEATARLRAVIAPGWHLYSLTPYPADVLVAPQPTTIKIEANPLFKLSGKPRQPKPKSSLDENFGIETTYFDAMVDFEVPVRVSREAGPGSHTVPLQVRFMACNDRLCLPPQTVAVSASLQVEGEAQPLGSAFAQAVEQNPPEAAPATPVSPPAPDPPVEEPVQEAGMPSGLLAYLLFAMAGGGLALLTPCVFPMIPITVSYFTKREVTRSRAVSEASLYAVGIVLTFTFLGFLLTALWGAGGINRIATSPLINLIIATVFVVFALSLFGALEIRIPSSWLSAVDKKSSSTGGPVGILLMALAFSLTSFTCTVPFVGTVMVAATQGDWLWSLLGVTAFATVFAAPFFFLALFPSWLKSLPKSGSWMNSMKVTMGFLELAAAMKFLSNVDLVYQWELLTRPVFITVWLAIAVVLSIYLLGRFSFPHEAPVQQIGAFRVLSAIFFVAVSFYLLRGLFGASLGELDAFLPPRDYGSDQWTISSSTAGGARESEVWLTDYSEGLAEAGRTGKSIFVDFTGYTCTNCRWMEANIFPRPRVRELLSRYVLVRLYTDGGKPEHEANLEMEKSRFKTIALPLYALMSPQDTIIAQFPGLTRSEDEFVDFLQQGL